MKLEETLILNSPKKAEAACGDAWESTPTEPRSQSPRFNHVRQRSELKVTPII